MWPIFLAFLPTQAPLAVLEGVLTGGVLRSLSELRPDVAGRLGWTTWAGIRRRREPWSGRARLWWREARRPLRWTVASLVGLVVVGLGWAAVWALARKTGGWVGLDAGVMEQVAGDAGRPAWRPFINTDVGDLLLFVFLAGAFVAGGVIGWLVRALRVAAAPATTLGSATTTAVARHADPGLPSVRRPARADGSADTGGGSSAAGLVAVGDRLGRTRPGLGCRPLRGANVARVVDIVLHPSRQSVLSRARRRRHALRVHGQRAGVGMRRRAGVCTEPARDDCGCACRICTSTTWAAATGSPGRSGA